MPLTASPRVPQEMDIVGVGYKAELKGKSILFALGYSHSIEFVLPEGVIGKGREAAADDHSVSDEHHSLGDRQASARPGRREHAQAAQARCLQGKGCRYANRR